MCCLSGVTRLQFTSATAAQGSDTTERGASIDGDAIRGDESERGSDAGSKYTSFVDLRAGQAFSIAGESRHSVERSDEYTHTCMSRSWCRVRIVATFYRLEPSYVCHSFDCMLYCVDESISSLMSHSSIPKPQKRKDDIKPTRAESIPLPMYVILFIKFDVDIIIDE